MSLCAAKHLDNIGIIQVVAGVLYVVVTDRCKIFSNCWHIIHLYCSFGPLCRNILTSTKMALLLCGSWVKPWKTKRYFRSVYKSGWRAAVEIVIMVEPINVFLKDDIASHYFALYTFYVFVIVQSCNDSKFHYYLDIPPISKRIIGRLIY